MLQESDSANNVHGSSVQLKQSSPQNTVIEDSENIKSRPNVLPG